MRMIAILAALPLVLLLSAAPASADDAVITIKNFMFTPMTLIVPEGSTVTWDNEDGEPHTVVSLTGDFRSQALDEKDHFAHQFSAPGIYKYVCSIHPRMVGTITVVAETPRIRCLELDAEGARLRPHPHHGRSPAQSNPSNRTWAASPQR